MFIDTDHAQGSMLSVSVTEAMLKATDVAKLFGVNEATVRAWARQGKIPCRRLPGNKLRFHPAEMRKAFVPQPG